MARRSESPALFDLARGPDLTIERRVARDLARGAPVCGVDEAGRGPLAGPVVTAAVVLDPASIPDGLDDSKKLDEVTRELLFERICAGHQVAVACASVARIDRLNIRGATLWAMAQAVRALGEAPAFALIDGLDVPPGLCCPGEAVVKGDARSLSIAAASIVAKVTRDRLMVRLAQQCPGYGFDIHKGYGTAAHRAAILALGPSAHHRRSFEPVKSLVAPVPANASVPRLV
ncbi:ribonuclease HII [Prosthecodimorpha staleyi]|uniref:Ribonuclease HII n=1 Tax=Prosthecodimorpha staleyi TaxID=2840188 RepID=A0A947GEV2_9HYPH|nr:ribonuclease HII [Prosthecodimorpha staleyi]MBT9291951.1 ribonuclease HII [Prosthecodimorpha staleyi]